MKLFLSPGFRAFAGRPLLVSLIVIGTLLGLSGCAGYSEFRAGKRLLLQNQIEEGLAEMESAIRADPDSSEYKNTYKIARERAIVELLREGERLLQTQKWADAEKTYQRVLQLDTGNQTAHNGLKKVRTQVALSEQMHKAYAARDRQDWAQATAWLNKVLQQDPGHVDALGLQAELRRKVPPAAPENQRLSAAFRKPVSIEFREANLRQVFDVIARTSGLNFIFDKDIKPDQKTSISLRDSNVETAIHYLLLANQLERQVMNANTLFIYPNNAAKIKEFQDLSVRSFQLAYADARNVAAALKALFKGREVVVDEKLNLLVVRDTPEAIQVVEKMVKIYDVPEAEVMLELEIIEVSRSKLSEIGIRWPDSLSLTPLASDSGQGLTLNDLKQLNATGIGAQLGSLSFNLTQTDGKFNTLANPRIRVVNREKAKVLIGDKVPIVTVTTLPNVGVTENISYVDVGLKLDVEPTIYRGNDVLIKVSMEVSNVSGTQTTKNGSVAYSFGTRSANTILRLHDGETQVLAGLINDDDRESMSKIPGAGDLPIVGRLFGKNRDEGKKSEIILSITPRIVRNAQWREQTELEFSSGAEAKTRDQGGSSGAGSVSLSSSASSPATTSTPNTPAKGAAPPASALKITSPLPSAALGSALPEGSDAAQ